MNTIENSVAKGDRVYVTIRLSGIHKITLRFYIPTDKKEFIRNLSTVINYPNLKKLDYSRDDDEFCEPFEHSEFISNMLEILQTTFSDYSLTGICNTTEPERNKYKVTGLGKSAYVLYQHIGYNAETIEFFLSYDAAILKMFQWNGQSFIYWKEEDRVPSKRCSDNMTGVWLSSIDSITEFITYKMLYPDQIRYMVQMGLVELKK